MAPGDFSGTYFLGARAAADFMAYSRDFGRIFRNMDYWIEHKRLLFKLFRITKFSTRSDKSIRSSILSKLKKELASHFARCELTDRSVAIRILTLLMWQNFNTKRGTQQQKTVGMETLNTHFLLTVYILYKKLSSLRILSSLHKATKLHMLMQLTNKNQSFAQ